MTIAPDLTAGTVWALTNPRPGWTHQAACKGADPEQFVVGRSSTQNKAAIAVCGRCPVVDDCRVEAVRTDDQAAIRGAMTPIRRNRWLKDQGITRAGQTSPASQKNQQGRVGRRIPTDLGRIIQMRAQGSTFPEIGEALQRTERTVQRRYAEWERQQAQVEQQAGRVA
jgi:hypothetical protein